MAVNKKTKSAKQPRDCSKDEASLLDKLRAEIWKLAALKEEDEQKIIQALLDKLGPALDAERVLFTTIDGKQMIVASEWKAKGVKKTSLGIKTDIRIYNALNIRGQRVIQIGDLSGLFGKALKPFVKFITDFLVKKFGDAPSIITPYSVNGKCEGIIVTRSIKSPVDEWSRGKKKVVEEAALIVSKVIESKRAQRLINDKEIKYRALFDNMSNGSALHRAIRNKSGKITDFEFIEVNGAWLRDTGFDFKKEQMPGKKVSQVMPFLPPEAMKRLAEVVDKDNTWESVVPWGPARWLFIRAFRPMKDHIAIVCSDFTGIKNYENALKESEAKYRELFNNANDMVFVSLLDAGGKAGLIIEANGVACRSLKMTQEQIAKLTPAGLVDAASLAGFPAIGKELASKGRCVYETVMVDSSGGKISVEISSHVFLYKGQKAVLSIARNITERKMVEQSLKESEEKFRTLSEQSLIGIGIMKHGRFMYINDAFSSMTGYSRQELLSFAPWQFEQKVYEEDREFVAAQARGKMEGAPGMTQNYQFRIVQKSGSLKWLEIYSRTVSYMGESADLFAVADITGIKDTQAKLEKTIDELQRSNEELEKFAYVASHDLQEPLRMVSNYVQLLKRRYEGKLDSSADEFIGYAVEGAERMGKLIKDLLAYSRINTLQGDFKPVDLNDAVKAAVLNLEAAVKEKNARVVYTGLPVVSGDELQIVQLLQNLIGNGLKFAAPGVAPVVEVTSSVTGTMAEVCVRDNGIGISPKYFDKIFAIFQRLHSKNEYPGTGIGLSICKKIAERHGGTIWVESEEGKGARFYFTLAMKGVRDEK